MELTVIFTTAFLVGFSGAMMPGPMLTVTVSESARCGFIAGPLVTLGHVLLELVLIIALVGGFSAFLTTVWVARVIAVLGGAFLIYMGCGMVRDARAGKISVNLPASPVSKAVSGNASGEGPDEAPAGTAGGGAVRLHPAVAAGILTSISNPYWTLWWATVGLGYVTLSLRRGYAGLASFFTGHILADLVWFGLVAAAVAGGRRFLSDGVYRLIIWVCGIFLVTLGGYFIYSGLCTRLVPVA